MIARDAAFLLPLGVTLAFGGDLRVVAGWSLLAFAFVACGRAPRERPTRLDDLQGRGGAMLWIVTWCDYGIGAILALIATGNLTPWWFLATPVLAIVGGFLRGVEKARKA